MTEASEAPYKGSLELTWTNKGQRLIARDGGEYEWVPPGDHRAREVRLLHDAGEFGETHTERAKDNLLIRGDSLHALTSLTKLPEFADELRGKVKLVYIDPPFNTGQAFANYDDGLEHSVWLTMMRDRLVQLKELIAPGGSIWVHLDDAEAAYARLLLDETFGRQNFAGTIIWEKTDTLRNDATRFSVSHDYVLVYCKDIAQWSVTKLPRNAEMNKAYKNPDKDPRGAWLPVTLISPSYRSSGDFAVVTPSGTTHSPPAGTSWRMPRTTFDSLLSDNRIWFGKSGSAAPQRKLFLSEAGDRVVDTIWSVKDVGGNRQSKAEIKRLFSGIEPFATPKPERLLHRIIHVATAPGDVVLDCFGGSGTTAAVAHKMGRRWITIELERGTVESFTAPRLEKVVHGDDPGGITNDVEWPGGGGFRVLDVAESMYEDDGGTIVLAEWATQGALAEAVCAQLGFDYAPDGLFAGQRGRTRLAVIDGHVTTELVDMLVSMLGPKEVVSVIGVGLDPAAAAHLEKVRTGSRARTVPRDILLSYASPSAWRLAERAREEIAMLEQMTLDAEAAATPEAAE